MPDIYWSGIGAECSMARTTARAEGLKSQRSCSALVQSQAPARGQRANAKRGLQAAHDAHDLQAADRNAASSYASVLARLDNHNNCPCTEEDCNRDIAVHMQV
eukprot:350594-Chlamydomonas_euryale.AAC.4